MEEFDPIAFSGSVRKVYDGLEDPVTASEFASRIQQIHPEYGDGLFEKVPIEADRGPTQSAAFWLGAVAGLYDAEKVANARHEVIDGELTLAGLAELDPDLRAQLEYEGFLERLTAGIEAWPRQPAEPSETPVGDYQLHLLRGHEGPVRCVAWSPDGSRLASAGDDATVRVWDPGAGSGIRVLHGHAARVIWVEWSPDGSQLASGSADGFVRLWEPVAETSLDQLEHDSACWPAWSPDGSRVAIGSLDGLVRVWTPSAPSVVTMRGHEGSAGRPAWSPDGLRLASSGTDGAVRVWDPVEGSETMVLHGHEGESRWPAWSPDGRRVASGGSDGTLRVWDAEDGSDVAVLRGHESWVGWPTWSPDGARLASTARDGTVRVWDPEAGSELLVVQGHKGAAWGPAWSPDGARLATGGEDGYVCVWDWGEASEGLRLSGHVGRVRWPVWSPDGSRLATAGDDGTVRIWDVAPEERRGVPWLHDEPARPEQDTLARRPLGRLVATQLRRLRQEDPGRSFLVHIDGPWGSGKSTLLGFVTDDLGKDRSGDDEWLIVDFDAWRQSRVGPPWLSLLEAMRSAVADRLGKRFWLRERIRQFAPSDWLAVGLFAALLVIGIALFTTSRLEDVAGTVGLVTGVLSFLALTWTLSRGAARMLALNSERGAVRFVESERNPMEHVAAHFKWLLDRAGTSVLLVIDDLDRCDHDFVVELLDAVQTLMRDAPVKGDAKPEDEPDWHRPFAALWQHMGLIGVPRDTEPGPQRLDWRAPLRSIWYDLRHLGTLRGAEEAEPPPPPSLIFLVAADGRWIRESYQKAHEDFVDALEEPGRPLGYLFLDKLFQLSVPLPRLSPGLQNQYLAKLLGRDDEPAEQDAGVAQRRRRVEEAATPQAAMEAFNEAEPLERLELAEAAIETLTKPEAEAVTKHFLEGYAELLPPNPRSMKRFLMAFDTLRGARVAQGVLVDQRALALWAVLRIRWPALADELRARPDWVELVGADGKRLEEVPESLRPVLHDRTGDLERIVGFHSDHRLTADLIRLCAGVGDGEA